MNFRKEIADVRKENFITARDCDNDRGCELRIEPFAAFRTDECNIAFRFSEFFSAMSAEFMLSAPVKEFFCSASGRESGVVEISDREPDRNGLHVCRRFGESIEIGGITRYSIAVSDAERGDIEVLQSGGVGKGILIIFRAEQHIASGEDDEFGIRVVFPFLRERRRGIRYEFRHVQSSCFCVIYIRQEKMQKNFFPPVDFSEVPHS